MHSPIHTDCPTTNDLAVSVRSLRKAFRRGSTSTDVLSGVDLDVPRGQCVYLVGPSGSGKSTLLSILGCILSPDAGELRILDRDMTRASPNDRIQVRRDVMGFVFQRFQLFRGLSVFDNILIPLRLQRRSLGDSRRRVHELLDAVGLTDHANVKPKNLSAGQCQRVAFARALSADPRIILADEPTASLDAASGNEIMQLLHDLITQYNKTAIVVTHDQRILSYADRVCRLEDGRICERLESRILNKE